MTNETHIITELRETINRAENMVPFMRSDMIQLLESAKSEIETLAANLKRMQSERDDARRWVCESEPVGNCLSVDDMYRRARVESARRGWDCYKEEETP
jgi:hypothetical protein